MSYRVYRIQAQLLDLSWKTMPGDYRTDWEAQKAARIRATKWRIVTGSGKVVIQGPQRGS